MTIRPARWDDARDRAEASLLLADYLVATEREKGLAVVDADGLDERYRSEVADPARAFGDSRVLLAEAGSRVAGVVVISEPDEARCELKRLWVDPLARGRGIAARLVERAVGEAALMGAGSVRLTVWEWREGARRLYRSAGFVEVAAWDARKGLICMERRLPAPGAGAGREPA